MNTISFTTTAMPRPEILDRTYSSFAKNLTDINLKDCTLYINIDNLPDADQQDFTLRNQVVDVAKKYFGHVIPNMPIFSHFGKALQWCWSQPNTDYLFHIEDDWILLEAVSLNTLIDLIKDNKYQACIRAYPFRNSRPIDRWNEDSCLSPSLWSTKFCKQFVNQMIDQNPEQALREYVKNNYSETITAFYSDKVLLQDIGRTWLANSIYMRAGCQGFRTWLLRNKLHRI